MTQQPKESVKSVGHMPWQLGDKPSIKTAIKDIRHCMQMYPIAEIDFIVRCVNSHQALLETMQGATEVLQRLADNQKAGDRVSAGSINEVRWSLEKAISLTETEQGK